MKKVRSLSASFCAALFLTALCACAIPLVPNSRLSGNTLISSRGELITEITFTNASPYIPENTKGPELDQTPVLIPSPSNPAQLGWILFPANQTNKGRDIVSVSKSGLPNGGSLFGYYLDGSKQRHNIDVSSQINSVSRLQIDLPNPGQPYSRISAFPLNEGNVPNRLIVLTQGDSTSNSYQLYVLVADYFQSCFSDISNYYAAGTTYNQNIFPGFIIDSSNLPQVILNDGSTINSTVTTPWDSIATMLISAAAAPDRSTIYIIGSKTNNTPGYFLNNFSFTPSNPITLSPYYSGSSFSNGANFIQNTNDSHSYVSTNAPNNQFHISTYNPDGSQTYVTSSIYNVIKHTNVNSYPIVRYLQDNSVLALVDNQWRKVNAFDPATGVPSSLSPAIQTGSMIFDYDYTDGNGIKWMVFSETFVQPVAPNFFDNDNKDNLVMRAWRVKQSDLIP